jgi:hypothetical protein
VKQKHAMTKFLDNPDGRTAIWYIFTSISFGSIFIQYESQGAFFSKVGQVLFEKVTATLPRSKH